MDAATASATTGSTVVSGLGAVVLYLPQDLSDPAAALLRSVGDRVPLTVIAGVSGVVRADTPVRAAVGKLTDDAESAAWEHSHAPAHGTRVVSASDPDDEVRAVVRLVIDALRDGVPLDRMAILFGSAEPYARLVHEQLDAAGIAHNGAAVRTLGQSVLGASLLALLALPDRDFHRHDVMVLLASAPVHQRDGREVPSARWERISRRAGIVRGASHWHRQLERHVGVLEHELAEELAVTHRDPRPAWYERELAACRELQAFVAELQAELATGRTPGASWRGLAAWAQDLVERRLAGACATRPMARFGAGGRRQDRGRAGAPRRARRGGARAGHRRVPAHAGARARRRSRPRRPARRRHLHGPRHARARARPRPRLPLRPRRRHVPRASARRLAASRCRPEGNGRLAHAALGACRQRSPAVARGAGRGARAGAAVPPGDLRRTTERMPSRFLLDTVEALQGARHYADDLATLSAPWFTSVPSFTAGIAASSSPRRIRSIGSVPCSTTPARATRSERTRCAPTTSRSHRGLDCAIARAGSAFTRFDGNLAPQPVPSPAGAGASVSPTRLEAWAASPSTT